MGGVESSGDTRGFNFCHFKDSLIAHDTNNGGARHYSVVFSMMVNVILRVYIVIIVIIVFIGTS